ncbi:MAG TPA: hypothetical protein VH599_01380 [Ktedonobacterales bacterium]|jgi:hypothetical protein
MSTLFTWDTGAGGWRLKAALTAAWDEDAARGGEPVLVAPPSRRLNAGLLVRWPGGRTPLVAPPSRRPPLACWSDGLEGERSPGRSVAPPGTAAVHAGGAAGRGVLPRPSVWPDEIINHHGSTNYRGPLVAPPSRRLNAGLLVRWPGERTPPVPPPSLAANRWAIETARSRGQRARSRSGGRLEGGATSTDAAPGDGEPVQTGLVAQPPGAVLTACGVGPP